MIINTILGNGQSLKPEVLKAITNQSVECELKVYTSPQTTPRRLSMNANWNTAFENNTADMFILIDGDVVLKDPDTIKKLLACTEDIVGIKTKPSRFPHSVIMIRRELPLFEVEKTNGCQFCQWLRDKDMKVLDLGLYEIGGKDDKYI